MGACDQARPNFSRLKKANMINRRTLTTSLAIFALYGQHARAENYPEKPIKVVVPYPPGASTDALARLLSNRLSGNLNQSIVVDNRAGASGNIGSDYVAKSASDGYTILLGTDATHASNMSLLSNPPYHPVNDFTALTMAVMNPVVLVAHPSVHASDMNSLIAAVKSNPNLGLYGSSGTGSPHHLAGELLKRRSMAAFEHVPYKGGGPALNDALGGQIPLLFASLITVLPHIQTGRLKALAFTGLQRYEELPGIPTIAETQPGFEMNSWLGFFGPANLPPPIAQRLNLELVKALQNAEIKTKLASSGLFVVGNSMKEFRDMVEKDFRERARIIKDAGIKPD